MLGSRLRKVWSKKRRSKFLGRTRFQLMDHYCGDCGPLVGDMEISMAPWCPLHSGSRCTCVPLDGRASGTRLLQCPSYGCSSPWKEALSSPTLPLCSHPLPTPLCLTSGRSQSAGLSCSGLFLALLQGYRVCGGRFSICCDFYQWRGACCVCVRARVCMPVCDKDGLR